MSPFEFFKHFLQSNVGNLIDIKFGYYLSDGKEYEKFERDEHVHCTLVSLPDEEQEFPQCTSSVAMKEYARSVLAKVLLNGKFINIQLHDEDVSVIET